MLKVTHEVKDSERETKVSKVIRLFGMTIYRYEAVETRCATAPRAVGFSQYPDERVQINDDDDE